MKTLSQIISYIFHPLIIPTIGVFIIFNSGTYMSNLIPEAKQLIYILVFTSTFLFPVLIMPFLLWQKIINSVYAETSKERIIPILLTLIFYYFGYYIISSYNISGLIRAFYLASIISLTVTFFINIKWKISTHMIGLGGLVGLVIGISLRLDVDLIIYLILLVFISGLVGSARLKLNSHNIHQISAGFYIGVLVVLSTILFY
jgi:hypothetical protein